MTYANFNDTDFDRVDKQENKSFNLAVSAFKMVYSACTGYTIEYTPMQKYCKADMRYFVSGDTAVHRYVGEIKTRNKNIGMNDTLPLIQRKYEGLLRERKKGEKLFYISFCLNSWWLFDLDDLDWNEVIIDDWYIQDVQYTTKEKKYGYYKTLFIPTKLAKIHGLCIKGIPIAISSDKNCTA